MNNAQRDQEASVRVSERTRLVRELLGGLAILLLIALGSQWLYLSAGHVWDDLRHLHNIGEVLCGKSSWSRFLLTFHNEHFLPFWKLWYVGTWRLAGVSPEFWHLGIVFFHAMSALALGGTIRASGGSVLVSRLIALFWAIATIGGFDNPLIWIASSHFAMSTMWVLFACWTTASYLHVAKNWKALLVIAFVSAAGLTMSAAVVFSVVVPLMAMSHLTATTRQKWQVVGLWMLPVALILGWQLWTKLDGGWVTPSREYSKEFSPFAATIECFMMAGSRTLMVSIC